MRAIGLSEVGPETIRRAAAVHPITDLQILHILDAARQLNPDTQPDVVRAQVALRGGEKGAAERILKRVVRREPENIDAWFLLQIATFHYDTPTNVHAGVRVRQLAGHPRRGP